MSKIVKARRYTQDERKVALARAEKVGPAAAGRELGIPEGTICNWRYYSKRKVEAASPAPKTPRAQVKEPEAKPDPAKSGKLVAKLYTPSQQKRLPRASWKVHRRWRRTSRSQRDGFPLLDSRPEKLPSLRSDWSAVSSGFFAQLYNVSETILWKLIMA